MNWKIKKIKVSELKENPSNPRRLTEKGLKDLEKSILKFGIAEPLVVNTDYMICGGHGRKKILEKLNIKEVDCYLPDKLLSKKQFDELGIRLNKNIAGEFNFDTLANEFEIDELIEWGFEEKELDLNLWNEIDETKLDEVPEVPKVAVSKLGDLFEIDGKHRVMCGDSTNAEDVDMLMDGQKAEMSFTSPPYNVGHNIGYKTKSKYLNSDDNLSDWKKLIFDSTNLSLDYAKDVFVNLQILANNKKDIIKLWYELIDNFKDVFYWKKLQVQPAIANNVVNSAVEVIMLFGKENVSRSWGNKKFRGNVSNYIETKSNAGENKNSDVHNAGFPIKLPLYFLSNGYTDNINVLDLFIGTGTTLIACQQTNRKCFGMEIDPIYIDVILKRYKKLYPDSTFKCLNRKFDFDKLFAEV